MDTILILNSFVLFIIYNLFYLLYAYNYVVFLIRK